LGKAKDGHVGYNNDDDDVFRMKNGKVKATWRVPKEKRIALQHEY
jgi:hypothetical protein